MYHTPQSHQNSQQASFLHKISVANFDEFFSHCNSKILKRCNLIWCSIIHFLLLCTWVIACVKSSSCSARINKTDELLLSLVSLPKLPNLAWLKERRSGFSSPDIDKLRPATLFSHIQINLPSKHSTFVGTHHLLFFQLQKFTDGPVCCSNRKVLHAEKCCSIVHIT
jgi:hypothetical protein